MSGGLGKMLIQLGIVLIIAGVVIHFGSKIFPFGNLPGDIHMEGKHGSFYFPLKTEKNGIEYILTACDKVAFKLVKIY